MPSALEQLKTHTMVVADTGDFSLLEKYKPQDSTTNPSLILAASKMPAYEHLVSKAIEYGKANGETLDEKVENAIDMMAVLFGLEILKIVPGRVSTEIDAGLSFDTEGTLNRARRLISLYEKEGINVKERLLLKIASTWEGLQAAKQLESEGYHCNLTLLFHLCQAAVAAEIGATLISPFAGRITDFYKQKQGISGFKVEEDPGVLSVKSIYNYYKVHGYKTIVMGASFRTKEQVLELAGCDALTISPMLLEELKEDHSDVQAKLSAASAATEHAKMQLTEKQFRWMLNQDEMATLKLSEGIRKFHEDTEKLREAVRAKLQA
mmetsp:Transcript_49766/g.125089  ORF Transcript_49766/g.125089 Transcript_49766/m.125089 type:complete len:322 (+) Transcript_49766:46-1011(+)|eukprot:CAMPEP_0177638570 /NCGR_PEP_ID=MMETSP0447-20121125/5560_1 /TAXON_ID=0 /ORGANISM="Stygamoeba regulata, Strain BSH-02190019" /LENGTH=321 /DNA_ID=CAMNT_0019140543 /DNA_START=38 /DNA_END=1003 /DNA_ORIENTATION=-